MRVSLIDPPALRFLRKQVTGPVLTADDAEYDAARRVWNGRFDRRPGAIVRCRDAADVRAAVGFARSRDLPAAVRSGGHDFAGNSICDDGVVIDLSLMTGIAVDPASRTLRVQAGARWGAVDRKTQAFGLATTGGTVSTVGVAGFTLGGGSGYLVRKHGLALDNLLAADVVTARGEQLRASERENADLFWALRGGGGNFGIVTALDLRLHELRPQVLAGQVIHRFDAAGDVLRFYRAFMADAPEAVQCYPFLIRIPPVSVFPEAIQGQVAIDLVVCHAGDVAEGERILAPLRGLGKPVLDTVAPLPYVAQQQAFDAGTAPGTRWYSKAHYLRELSDSAIETILAHAENLPGAFTMVYLDAQGGAVGRIAADATAFPHRHAPLAIHIFPGWTEPADDASVVAWARSFHQAMSPDATGGVYVNMLGGDEPDGPRSAYGSNYGRLVELKKKYDPANFFRMNHNVAPSA